MKKPQSSKKFLAKVASETTGPTITLANGDPTLWQKERGEKRKSPEEEEEEDVEEKNLEAQALFFAQRFQDMYASFKSEEDEKKEAKRSSSPSEQD